MKTSVEVAETIKRIAREKNISINAMLTDLGLNKNAIYTMKVSMPRADTIEKIAKYLNVPPHLIWGEEPQGVLGVFNPQYVPIVGSVKAGWNGIAETEFEGKHVAFGKSDYSEYVFMRIKGDSMSPKMEDGDLALVHLQNYAANGDYAVVIVNGDEGTVKIYRELENGALLLSPVNPAYTAVFVPKEANTPVMVYGVVKGITRDF